MNASAHSAGNEVLYLLLVVVALLFALQSAKRAYVPIQPLVRPLAAAAVAVFWVIVALALVVLAVAMGGR